ncbi:THO complex subunit 5 [Clydaea vesicula]|uniref:THO complex subunit 5 n=1 Tax=Clydaea vesicula TaxID=447962 RepID=A0AAD5UC70_9FUNG|nr:THO complex subunit 5 [Clydaea vesicula]
MVSNNINVEQRLDQAANYDTHQHSFQLVKDIQDAIINNNFVEADSLIIELVQLQRNLTMKNKYKKDETVELKNKNQIHLSELENIRYRAKFLQHELTETLNFETKYHLIKLLPLEEYLSISDDKETNQHRLMINRLNYELESRKKLREKEIKNKLIDNNLKTSKKVLQDKLEKIDAQIEQFIKATEDLQDTFGLKITKKHVLKKKGKFLPNKLSTMFLSLVDFDDKNEKVISIEIEGDQTEARSISNILKKKKEEKKINENVEKMDIDEITGGNDDVEDEEEEDETEINITKIHPLQVIVTLLKTGVKLVFSFLTESEAILVKPILTSNLEFIPSSYILDFDNSWGVYKKFTGNLEKISQNFVSEDGSPYLWAQQWTGDVSILPNCSNSEIFKVNTKTFDLINSRYLTLRMLDDQLKQLKAGNPKLQVPKSGNKFETTLNLQQNYPKVSPIWKIINFTSGQTSQNLHAMKNEALHFKKIEFEINIKIDKFKDIFDNFSLDLLLGYQLVKMSTCFENFIKHFFDGAGTNTSGDGGAGNDEADIEEEISKMYRIF